MHELYWSYIYISSQFSDSKLLLKGIYSNIYQIIGNRNFSLQLTKLLLAAVVRKNNINKQIDEKQLPYAVDFYFLLQFKFFSYFRLEFWRMSYRALYLRRGWINENAPLNNGIGRFIPQLMRLTIKFCKERPTSQGVR